MVEDLGVSIGMLEALYADPSKTRARATGGLRALAARPEVDAARIGAIGFCFGGTMSLELARSGADFKAVVGFHSGLATVAPKTDAKAIKARILVCIGGEDPFIPLEQRAAFETEMRDAVVDWQMNVYGTPYTVSRTQPPPTPKDPTQSAITPTRTSVRGNRCRICLSMLSLEP